MKEFILKAMLVLLIIISVSLVVAMLLNTDKPMVYLQNSEVNEAQLEAYARGYKAGYQQATTDKEEREYIDGGAR